MNERTADIARAFVRGIVPTTPGSGWATTSLFLSLRNAFLLGMVGLTTFAALGLMVDGGGEPWLIPMLGATAAVAALALLARRERVPAGWAVYASYATAFGAVALSADQENLQTFTGNWMVLLASALPAVMLRDRAAFAVHFLGCVGYSVGIALIHPDWGATIPQGQVIAGYSIFLVLRTGLAVLAGVTAQVDAQALEATNQRERAAWLRELAAEAAENARTLHDTVINTLAAIAAGGGATRDHALVRERCAQDLAVLDDLLRGDSHDPDQSSPFAFLRHAGITVHRIGLVGDELIRRLSQEPVAVVNALERASLEIVQNAAKHAHVESIRFDVRDLSGALQLTFTDDGVGFDPGALPARGFTNSVLERATLHGIDVQLSSSPGKGTQVVLTTSAHTIGSANAEDESDGNALESVVALVREGAAWLWAPGVVLVGILLELTSQPGRWTPTYPALALGALGVLIAVLGRNRPASWMVNSLLLALIIPTFVLSAATSGYGTDQPVLWQILVDTGLLILLGSRSAIAGNAGLVVHLATAGAVAAQVWNASSTASLIILVGGLTGAWFALGWRQFEYALADIGENLAESRRRIALARLEVQKRDAASEARQRWRAASLERVHDIVRDLAQGRLMPDDPVVRRECGEEESYIRQLVQLSPDLVRLGPWLVRALGTARARGVSLTLNTSSVEPADDLTAEALGRLLVALGESPPAGTAVRASLSEPAAGGLLLTSVAPTPGLADVAHWPTPEGTTVTVTTHGTQDLLEVMIPCERNASANP